MAGGRVLVVGAGIAGMASAIRLRQVGWEPTIVERSAQRRTGGYFIGLFPEGKDAAQRLGIYEHLHTRNPDPSRTWEIDAAGNRSRGMGFSERPGHPDSVLRGDVEETLWEFLDGVPVRFGLSPVGIEEHADGVKVQLRDVASGEVHEEEYDLVVGADGLRSTVRKLVFGDHERFMKSMEAIICAFQLEEQVPYFAPKDGLVLAEARRALWVFPFEDRVPTVLFTYRTNDVDSQFSRPHKEVIREVFGDITHSDVIRNVLDQLDRASELLFDSVYQVHMPKWHTRRVVLMGDAAWCMTLYSGMGATAGLHGSCVLGDMFEKYPGDLDRAFDAWEAEMRPFVHKNQGKAHVLGQMFVPGNEFIAGIRRHLLQMVGRKASHTEG